MQTLDPPPRLAGARSEVSTEDDESDDVSVGEHSPYPSQGQQPQQQQQQHQQQQQQRRRQQRKDSSLEMKPQQPVVPRARTPTGASVVLSSLTSSAAMMAADASLYASSKVRLAPLLATPGSTATLTWHNLGCVRSGDLWLLWCRNGDDGWSVAHAPTRGRLTGSVRFTLPTTVLGCTLDARLAHASHAPGDGLVRSNGIRVPNTIAPAVQSWLSGRGIPSRDSPLSQSMSSLPVRPPDRDSTSDDSSDSDVHSEGGAGVAASTECRGTTVQRSLTSPRLSVGGLKGNHHDHAVEEEEGEGEEEDTSSARSSSASAEPPVVHPIPRQPAPAPTSPPSPPQRMRGSKAFALLGTTPAAQAAVVVRGPANAVGNPFQAVPDSTGVSPTSLIMDPQVVDIVVVEARGLIPPKSQCADVELAQHKPLEAPNQASSAPHVSTKALRMLGEERERVSQRKLAVAESTTFKYYAVLTIRHQRYKTLKSARAEPTWNEDCTFSYDDPGEVLQICLFRKRKKAEFVGLAVVELARLPENQLMEGWYPLRSAHGHVTGRISILAFRSHHSTRGFLRHKGYPTRPLPYRLQPGDVVLFSNTKFSSNVTKIATRSKWDHVGLVVKGRGDSLCLLEAIGEGVRETSLDHALEKFAASCRYIGIRRVSVVRTPSMLRALDQFCGEAREAKYNWNVWKMMKRQRRESGDVQRLFCSQLVAAAWIRMGVLPKDNPSSNFMPGTLARPDLRTVPGIRMSPLIVFPCAPGDELRHLDQAAPRMARLRSALRQQVCQEWLAAQAARLSLDQRLLDALVASSKGGTGTGTTGPGAGAGSGDTASLRANADGPMHTASIMSDVTDAVFTADWSDVDAESFGMGSPASRSPRDSGADEASVPGSEGESLVAPVHATVRCHSDTGLGGRARHSGDDLAAAAAAAADASLHRSASMLWITADDDVMQSQGLQQLLKSLRRNQCRRATPASQKRRKPKAGGDGDDADDDDDAADNVDDGEGSEQSFTSPHSSPAISPTTGSPFVSPRATGSPFVSPAASPRALATTVSPPPPPPSSSSSLPPSGGSRDAAPHSGTTLRTPPQTSPRKSPRVLRPPVRSPPCIDLSLTSEEARLEGDEGVGPGAEGATGTTTTTTTTTSNSRCSMRSSPRGFGGSRSPLRSSGPVTVSPARSPAFCHHELRGDSIESLDGDWFASDDDDSVDDVVNDHLAHMDEDYYYEPKVSPDTRIVGPPVNAAESASPGSSRTPDRRTSVPTSVERRRRRRRRRRRTSSKTGARLGSRLGTRLHRSAELKAAALPRSLYATAPSGLAVYAEERTDEDAEEDGEEAAEAEAAVAAVTTTEGGHVAKPLPHLPRGIPPSSATKVMNVLGLSAIELQSADAQRMVRASSTSPAASGKSMLRKSDE